MRKLFISYVVMVGWFNKGTVTLTDLETGLFYLIYPRRSVIIPAGKYNFERQLLISLNGSNPERGRELYDLLVAALKKGETEGRVVWGDVKVRRSYKELNDLLVRNGFTGIATGYDRIMRNRAYCFPGVNARVKEAGLPLDVI